VNTILYHDDEYLSNEIVLMIREIGMHLSVGSCYQEIERIYSYLFTYLWKHRREYNDYTIWKYRFFSDYFWMHEKNLKELNSRVMTLTTLDVYY
jgi:hypothetical protein